MIDLKIISGLFSAKEAEKLLKDVFNAKISFHEWKIQKVHKSEEDIKHSEKRVIELNQQLRDTLALLRSNPEALIDIEADIKVAILNRNNN